MRSVWHEVHRVESSGSVDRCHWAIEGVVTHQRLREISAEHGHDLSLALQRLVRTALLVSTGAGKGTAYILPGADLPKPEDIFASIILPTSSQAPSSSEHLAGSSEYLEVSSEHLAGSPEHLEETSQEGAVNRDSNGCVLSDRLDAPIVDSLEQLTPVFRERLEALAHEPRHNKRLSQQRMRAVIGAACAECYLTLDELASLLNPAPDALRSSTFSFIFLHFKVGVCVSGLDNTVYVGDEAWSAPESRPTSTLEKARPSALTWPAAVSTATELPGKLFKSHTAKAAACELLMPPE